MTLVWGIRKTGEPEMVQRAEWLFDMLDNNKAQIIVPAVVVSEFLVPIKIEDYASVMASISSRFMVMPFDANCAVIAAQLHRTCMGYLADGTPGSRVALRADTMIVATAKEKGAQIFYSNDTGCRNVAEEAKITARDLPDAPETLFG